MIFASTYISEFESLSDKGIYCIAKIEWWLLKLQDEYNNMREEESKHHMTFIEKNWVKLPHYFDSRTPEEKFLHLYDTLDTISELHKDEKYFKQEMAIYKAIKNDSEKVKKWLSKNEHLGAEKYFMFSLDYFGEEDEMENEFHLQVSFLKDSHKTIFIDRNDFKFTIEFTNTFKNVYWYLLEELNLKRLN
ncbi:hypothetical protein [Winogradskyella sediminis]|uniref:hypothetical protein n=1 Tax=Winogradskyella sediminis TaxID=1382466 RepID=UPI003AA9A1F0